MRKLIALAGLALAGCAGTGDPGPYPANYKQLIAGYVRANYADPYSMRDVAVGAPVPGHYGATDGWWVCFQENAKNRMGGYTGLRQSAFFIAQDQIHAADLDMGYALEAACAGRTISPWPEMEMAGGSK